MVTLTTPVSEKTMTDQTVKLINTALDNSLFFSEMKQGTLKLSTFKYASQQFKFYRDNLHVWVGLVQFKSPICDNIDVEKAVLGIANHNVVEMEYRHGEMYCEYLKTLGFTDQEIQSIEPGKATKDYQESFVRVHGLGSANFWESLAAFSARELLASKRNTLIKNYLLGLDIQPSDWVLVHEQVEYDHFVSISQPIIKRHEDNKLSIENVIEAMKGEINRHIQWWDRMMEECITN